MGLWREGVKRARKITSEPKKKKKRERRGRDSEHKVGKKKKTGHGDLARKLLVKKSGVLKKKDNVLLTVEWVEGRRTGGTCGPPDLQPRRTTGPTR